MSKIKSLCAALLATCPIATIAAAPACAQQQQQKPNILAIMGDDIGYWNISAYNRVMMGYRTPNSDFQGMMSEIRGIMICGGRLPVEDNLNRRFTVVAMARAKRLDAQGNRSGCTRALAEVKRMYNLQ
jgi:hypothetical protein